MLNVGFVLIHPFGGSPGSVIRIRELARSLSKGGVKCHVYTPFSENKFWGESIQVRSLHLATAELDFLKVLYDKVRLLFNSRYIARNFLLKGGILNRMINKLAKQIVCEVEKDALDIIQGEQELAALACSRIRDDLGIITVADLHNIWPEELVAMNVIERGSQQFEMLQRMEEEVVQNSDSLVIVSQEMREYIKENYESRGQRVTVVPPGGRPRRKFPNRKEPPSKVVYAGLVTHRAHVDLLVQSMPIIKREREKSKFYITGKGEALRHIRRLARNLKTEPSYFWYENLEDFYRFLSLCHVGVVPSSGDIARKMGIPVKLFDYFSVGVPVVANDIGSWTNIIREEKVGILTEDDSQEFAGGILKLLGDREFMYSCGLRGIELVKTKYNWDVSAKALLDQYKAIA